MLGRAVGSTQQSFSSWLLSTSLNPDSSPLPCYAILSRTRSSSRFVSRIPSGSLGSLPSHSMPT